MALVKAFFSYIATPASISGPSSVSANEGDTVRFYFNRDTGTTAATLTGLASTVWTSTTNGTIAAGGYVDRVIKAGSTGRSDAVTITASGVSKTTTVNVIALDKTPDAVSFENKTLQARSTWVESEWVTLTGFQGSTVARVTGNGHGDCKHRIKTAAGVVGAWVASGTNSTVNVGDQIKLQLLTSSGYSTSRGCTMYAGGVGVETSTVWTLTTEPSPTSGQTIYLGITNGAISLNDLRQHFGPFSGAASLDMYYRGGAYVPDISVNAGVPTSGSISLDDFYGSATTLYFIQAPASHFQSVDASSGGAWSVLKAWNISSAGEIRLGFGDGMNSAVEVKFDHTHDSGQTYNATVSCESGSFGVWAPANTNRWCRATHSGSGRTDRDLGGTFTVSIRHPKAPSNVLTHTFGYDFFIWSGL